MDNNCYGFVRAWLLNKWGDSYFSRDEAFEWIKWIKTLYNKFNKIQLNTSDNIRYCLSENSENKYSIIEIFDWDGISQHVAFLDYAWNFYDQNW